MADKEQGLPNSLLCPITHEIMVEPVIAGDGHTYERAAIVSWLLKSDRSPVTNERLSTRHLLPNYALRKCILEYCEETGRQLQDVGGKGTSPEGTEAAPAGEVEEGAAVEVDEDLGQLSWRDGYLSDWLLVVGDATYAVHRANLAAGPRASSFFRKVFAAAAREDAGTTSTDLSTRLPRDCWAVMDQVLDFMYDGVFKPTSESVFFLLKASVVLGMKELRLRSTDYINVTLDRQSALQYLRHAHLECPGTRDVFLSSIHVAAVNFNDYEAEALNGLPFQVFVQLLTHEQLHSYDKTLSNTVCSYARANEARLDAESFATLADHLKTVAVEDAVYFLGAASRFHIPRLVDRCIPTVASFFDRVAREDVAGLAPDVLLGIVRSDDLRLSSEDAIFNLIQEYARCHPSLPPSTLSDLWRSCRWCLLSVDSFIKALSDSSVPRDLVTEAAVARLLLKEKGPEHLASQLLDQPAPHNGGSFRSLQPFHAAARRALLHRNQFIPGCRVAIRVAGGGGKLAPPAAEGSGDALSPSSSSAALQAGGSVMQGVLVAINDHNRCDVLCDNGSYEVDVAYSDLQPAAAAATTSSSTTTGPGASAVPAPAPSSRRSSRDRDRAVAARASERTRAAAATGASASS